METTIITNLDDYIRAITDVLIDPSSKVFITGMPGTGKSWAVTNLRARYPNLPIIEGDDYGRLQAGPDRKLWIIAPDAIRSFASGKKRWRVFAVTSDNVGEVAQQLKPTDIFVHTMEPSIWTKIMQRRATMPAYAVFGDVFKQYSEWSHEKVRNKMRQTLEAWTIPKYNPSNAAVHHIHMQPVQLVLGKEG